MLAEELRVKAGPHLAMPRAPPTPRGSILGPYNSMSAIIGSGLPPSLLFLIGGGGEGAPGPDPPFLGESSAPAAQEASFDKRPTVAPEMSTPDKSSRRKPLLDRLK
jgi:hypothetical protein